MFTSNSLEKLRNKSTKKNKELKTAPQKTRNIRLPNSSPAGLAKGPKPIQIGRRNERIFAV